MMKSNVLKKSNLHIFVWKKVIISVNYFVNKLFSITMVQKEEVGKKIMSMASFESC